MKLYWRKKKKPGPYLELGVDLPDWGWGVLFPEGTGLWVLGSILSFLAAGESMLGPCLLPGDKTEKTSLFGME